MLSFLGYTAAAGGQEASEQPPGKPHRVFSPPRFQDTVIDDDHVLIKSLVNTTL